MKASELIKMVREQQRRIEQLEQEISLLKSRPPVIQITPYFPQSPHPWQPVWTGRGDTTHAPYLPYTIPYTTS